MSLLREQPDLRVVDLILSLERQLGARITIHDLSGLFRPLAHEEITDRLRHHHPFCSFKREGTAWGKSCIAYCQWEVNRQVKESGEAIVSQCWKGGSEVVVPIIHDHVHVATFFVGVFRSAAGEQEPAAREVWQKLPELHEGQAEAIASTITFLVPGIMQEIDRFHQLYTNSNDRGTMIRRFIHYHFHEKLRLEDLARAIYLSPSRTSHIVTELFGASFQQLVLKERVRRAKGYLLDTELTQEHITELCGFANRHYFSKQFKRMVGMSPGQYRSDGDNSVHFDRPF